MFSLNFYSVFFTYIVEVGMDRFHFFENDRFVMKWRRENEKWKDQFLKIIFKKRSFLNRSISKAINNLIGGCLHSYFYFLGSSLKNCRLFLTYRTNDRYTLKILSVRVSFISKREEKFKVYVFLFFRHI